MATQSQPLVDRTTGNESSNGWEALLPRLDPAVVNTPRAQKVWLKLDRRVILPLTNSIAQFPWLNHLALASVIYAESGAAHSYGLLNHLHAFLRWAIPAHYPDVASLKPMEALLAYFGDPSRSRGDSACAAYSAFQLHLQRYLQALPLEERTKLRPFLLPLLVDTPQLAQLRRQAKQKGQAKRKEQAFAVVKDLPALVVMGRRRFKWLADLDAQVQQIAQQVAQQHIALPAVVQCRDLDNRQTLTFRVWDRISWIKAHRPAYGERVLYGKPRHHGLFLQLVGAWPDTPWFLRAAELGAFSPKGKQPHRTESY